MLRDFASEQNRGALAFIIAKIGTVLAVACERGEFGREAARDLGWESWQAYAELVVPHQAVIMNERHGVFLVMMPSAYMALRLFEVEPLLRIEIGRAHV